MLDFLLSIKAMIIYIKRAIGHKALTSAKSHTFIIVNTVNFSLLYKSILKWLFLFKSRDPSDRVNIGRTAI